MQQIEQWMAKLLKPALLHRIFDFLRQGGKLPEVPFNGL